MIVYLLATLDTKGAEAVFVRDRLTAAGVPTRLVDVGCLGLPAVVADISRERSLHGRRCLAGRFRRQQRSRPVGYGGCATARPS